jgi:hypothetical protein
VAPPLGLGALVVAVAVHIELLARLRRAEPASPWWFGYARDGVNLSAALMLWGGYVLCEMPPAAALLIGMMTGVTTYLIDWTAARALRARRPRIWVALPLLAWLAAFAWQHTAIIAATTRLIQANEPL